MTNEQVQKWLDTESKSGNSLANSYLVLMQGSTSEMRAYWYQQLGVVLETAEIIVKKINEEKAGGS